MAEASKGRYGGAWDLRERHIYSTAEYNGRPETDIAWFFRERRKGGSIHG